MQNQKKNTTNQMKFSGGLNGLPKIVLNEIKMVKTHLIDGIYQGFVNSSYQRDGFGILQTDQFQTYIGNFKYNKLSGIGLIIYTDGEILYGNFNAGLIDGIMITDNGHQIQIGTFKNCEMIGIGFQYSYEDKIWKMNRYHKGVTIQTINQEKVSIDDAIPKMFSLQTEILSHYFKYKTKNYFSNDTFKKKQTNISSILEDLNNFYFHQISQSQYYFGAMIDDQFEGLGVIYDPIAKKVTEVGTYKLGKLCGFGLKYSVKNNHQQMGFYIENKKQGAFFVKTVAKTKFVQFEKDILVNQDKREETIHTFKKRQKIHYYRQKDFLSDRNGIEIYQFKVVFESSSHKAWKLQEQSDKKQKTDSNNKGPEKAKVKTPTHHMGSATTMQIFEKSSIQMMKQKIYVMTNNPKHEVNKNQKPKVAISILKNQQIITGKKQDPNLLSDDQIAVEENPIAENVFIVNRAKKEVKFKDYNKHSYV